MNIHLNSNRVLRHRPLALSLATVLSLGTIGCGSGGDDGGGQAADTNEVSNNVSDHGGLDVGGLTVVNTGVDVHIQSLMRAGDRYIVYTSNAAGTSQAFAYDTQNRRAARIPDPEGTDYMQDFAVSGRIIVLRGTDLAIYIYDAETSAGPSRIGTEDDLLAGTDQGLIHTDGGDIVAFHLRWPDRLAFINTHDPTMIVTFGFEPDLFYSNPVVHEHRVIAMHDGDFHLFDADRPDAPPRVFEANAATTTAPAFDGRFVVYVDFATDEVMLLDVIDGTIANTEMRSGGGGVNNFTVAQEALDVGGGLMCGLNADETYGATLQSFVGSAFDGSLVLAPDQDLNNETSAGWGVSFAVTPDGHYAFIAGNDEPSGRCCDKLAVWNSGSLSTLFTGNIGAARDQDGHVIAANPVMGNGMVALRLAADGASSTIGFIRLP